MLSVDFRNGFYIIKHRLILQNMLRLIVSNKFLSLAKACLPHDRQVLMLLRNFILLSSLTVAAVNVIYLGILYER